MLLLLTTVFIPSVQKRLLRLERKNDLSEISYSARSKKLYYPQFSVYKCHAHSILGSRMGGKPQGYFVLEAVNSNHFSMGKYF